MRILVASSDRATRERLCGLAEAGGVGVIEAASSAEAIEAALIWSLAGAVVDVALGDLPGHRTAELIHQCRPSLPLVLLTDEPADAVPSWAMTHGAAGSLPKLFGPAEFEHALDLIRCRGTETPTVAA